MFPGPQELTINITVDDQFKLWMLPTEDQMIDKGGKTNRKNVPLRHGASDVSDAAAHIPVAAGGDIVIFAEKKHDQEYGIVFATDEGVYTDAEMAGGGERWKCVGGNSMEEITTLWGEGENTVQWPDAVLAPVMWASHVGPDKHRKYQNVISEKMLNGSAKYIWAESTQGKVPSAACCVRHKAIEPKHTGTNMAKLSLPKESLACTFS